MNALACTLADLPADRPAAIVSVNGEPTMRRRLMEFGFVPGSLVTLRTRSPLGDPLDVMVRFGRVSLRRKEAALITVRPC